MHKILMGTCLTALLCGTAHAQQHFKFEADLPHHPTNSAGVVTGTFDGILNGDLITDLSNINVFIDGVPFAKNGSLYNASYNLNNKSWSSGTAVASLDPSKNNFLFVDVNFPTNTQYTTYFFSVSQVNQAYAWVDSPRQYAYGTSGLVHVEVAGVPEPANWALMIGGFGLAGAALRTRRGKVAVRYA